MRLLQSAALSATLLVPLAYPPPGFTWNSLTYQQALAQCANGNDYACSVAYQYVVDAARQYSGAGGGSPADAWVSPDELSRGGLHGVRPGPLSTYDLVR